MSIGRLVGTWLAAMVATLLFAGAAQAGPGASGVPSKTEVDRALAALENGSGHVVELKRETPSWYTPALARKVRQNGVAAAPVDAPLPGEVGIRPGSMMISPFICTMNYLFQKSGVLAIGTAGHCLEAGQPVVLLTVAPTGGDPVLVQLGKVLLRRDGGIGKDYGLVQVPTSRRDWAFPTIGAIGGPCGIYSGGDPQPVAHYGHGVVGGTGGTPRAGMGFELPGGPPLIKVSGVGSSAWTWNSTSIVWAGYLYGGDSGSPVRTGQLPAVSNLTHGLSVTGLEPSPIGWGTKVSTITSAGWRLVNSPLCL
ncbi:MAG: hypothetical protein ABR581_03345 [Thermoleophilaceae bacterium]